MNRTEWFDLALNSAEVTIDTIESVQSDGSLLLLVTRAADSSFRSAMKKATDVVHRIRIARGKSRTQGYTVEKNESNSGKRHKDVTSDHVEALGVQERRQDRTVINFARCCSLISLSLSLCFFTSFSPDRWRRRKNGYLGTASSRAKSGQSRLAARAFARPDSAAACNAKRDSVRPPFVRPLNNTLVPRHCCASLLLLLLLLLPFFKIFSSYSLFHLELLPRFTHTRLPLSSSVCCKSSFIILLMIYFSSLPLCIFFFFFFFVILLSSIIFIPLQG